MGRDLAGAAHSDPSRTAGTTCDRAGGGSSRTYPHRRRGVPGTICAYRRVSLLDSVREVESWMAMTKGENAGEHVRVCGQGGVWRNR
jgi:hypothetical protein